MTEVVDSEQRPEGSESEASFYVARQELILGRENAVGELTEVAIHHDEVTPAAEPDDDYRTACTAPPRNSKPTVTLCV